MKTAKSYIEEMNNITFQSLEDTINIARIDAIKFVMKNRGFSRLKKLTEYIRITYGKTEALNFFIEFIQPMKKKKDAKNYFNRLVDGLFTKEDVIELAEKYYNYKIK